MAVSVNQCVCGRMAHPYGPHAAHRCVCVCVCVCVYVCACARVTESARERAFY